MPTTSKSRRLKYTLSKEVAIWSGTGPDYQVEAAVKYDDCQIKAYYLGEARHAFYSLDESGHMQVRPPMAYLNQIATSLTMYISSALTLTSWA